MGIVISILDILSYILGFTYIFVVYKAIAVFISTRKHWLVKVLAFLVLGQLALTIIYLNDPWNISLALVGFIVYLFVFYSGKWEKKVTAFLIFYPTVIAVNFLQQNVFSDLFFAIGRAPNSIFDVNDSTTNWTLETLLLSTAIYTLSLVVRLLFWIGAWIFLRRYRQQIASENIEKRTWLIVDAVMLVPTIAVFTAIFFITQANYIVYPLCVVIILGGLVSVSLIAYMSRSEQTAREAQRLQQQYAYYEDKQKAEEAVRRLYHDMKNHLLLLEKQDSPETRQMAADLRQQIADYEDYIHTGNDFLDIIIRDKARRAKEDEVDFSAVLHFEQGGFLEPIDISTIFGNALDNALEASLKLPPEQRLVTVKAECVRDMLSVVVENNCLPGEAGYEKTSKEDKFLHGFGIRNIKQAVEKYSGQCLIRRGESCFQLKILLPLP